MKRLCYLLSGAIAAILIAAMASPSSASALEVTYLSTGVNQFSSARVRFPTTGSSTVCSSHVGGNLNCFLDMAAAGSFTYGGMDLVSAVDIPANSVVRFTVTFSFPGSYSNLKFFGFSSQGDWTIINQQVLYDDYSSISINLEVMKGAGSNNTIFLVPFATGPVLTADVTNSRVIMTVTPYNRGTVIDGPWLVDSISDVRNKLSNIATTNTLLESIKNNGITAKVDQSGTINAMNQNTTAINNAANQAHKDSQAQLDWEKEQAKKEEEQRKKDEQSAQNSGNQSQTDADQSQSDVDNASASLFSIINGVKDTILQGSDKGDCTISGNFGFFDVGTINLCTGGGAVRPITTIVGSIMLIFFSFTAALTLINKFKDLYCEYMGYK